jgi:hypothetical protein
VVKCLQVLMRLYKSHICQLLHVNRVLCEGICRSFLYVRFTTALTGEFINNRTLKFLIGVLSLHETKQLVVIVPRYQLCCMKCLKFKICNIIFLKFRISSVPRLPMYGSRMQILGSGLLSLLLWLV